MNITISTSELITWIIVGLLAGTAAGAILTHHRRGYGLLYNLLLGVVGAFIGGILFNLLNISIAPGVSVSLDDVISALVGAFVIVLILRFSGGLNRRFRR